MNILVLTPNLTGFSPGQRSSIELWEGVLNKAGIRLHFVPFETERLHAVLYQQGHYAIKVAEMFRACLARLGVLKKLDAYDAVFIYREAALLGPALLEKAIAKRGKPVIYQLDDPLYIPYRSPANGYLSYFKFFSKIADIIRLSKVVIVNSSHIRDYASQFNQNIWQIPSLVDTDKYVYRSDLQKCDRVCIGWSGSPTTTGNLKIVASALKELQQRVEHDVYLIGGTDFDLPGVEYKAQTWNAQTEVNDLRRIHVGMVPLPNNEWNKRKFIMKSAQYMALGIPPVATPLASNPEVIEHGVTGFLAGTEKDWIEYLSLLVSDHQLRTKMSENAAQVAEARYSLRANSGKIVEAFRAAAT